MRLINITPSRKKKIIAMILFLFPEFDSVSIKNSNTTLILRKRKYWFFGKREILPITDMIIYHIPKRLDEKLNENGLRSLISVNINSMLELIMKCKSHNNYFDVTDYLWDRFLDLQASQESIIPQAELSIIHPKVIVLPLYLRNLNFLKVVIREKFYKDKVSLIESIRMYIVTKFRRVSELPKYVLQLNLAYSN